MNGKNAILQNFSAILPKHRLSQEYSLDWIAASHARIESDPEAKVKIAKAVRRFGCGPERIQTRYVSLGDFLQSFSADMRIFGANAPPEGQPAEVRSQFYSEVVGEAFDRFYAEQLSPPAAMIHVTCTGYVSPSGAQKLVARKGWGEATEVFHAYHMGCYAALPSVRLARGLLFSGKTEIDIVHTELCSLHFNPAQHTAEQLVVQTLFADGIIRYRLTSALSEGELGFEVVTCREEIVSGTENAMTWMATGSGMRMTLSREIPETITAVIRSFAERLFSGALRDLATDIEKAVFAIHPGGPRIIDQVQSVLKLRDDQIAASNSVLRERGNMSSATLPHIWLRILQDPEVKPGTLVASFAFGPGLTISAMILRKIAA